MRLAYTAVMPEAQKAMSGLQEVVEGSGLEHKLLELVKVRASQLNGCAYCLDMHTKDAIAIGEDPQRLNVLAAWRTCGSNHCDRGDQRLESVRGRLPHQSGVLHFETDSGRLGAAAVPVGLPPSWVPRRSCARRPIRPCSTGT
jgi:AhpD family alkylhydroperoxidase